jgi:hypothetical protein
MQNRFSQSYDNFVINRLLKPLLSCRTPKEVAEQMAACLALKDSQEYSLRYPTKLQDLWEDCLRTITDEELAVYQKDMFDMFMSEVKAYISEFEKKRKVSDDYVFPSAAHHKKQGIAIVISAFVLFIAVHLLAPQLDNVIDYRGAFVTAWVVFFVLLILGMRSYNIGAAAQSRALTLLSNVRCETKI